MAKKKKSFTHEQTYVKGIVVEKDNILDILSRTTEEGIEVHKQTVYDDDSQSITVTIHFHPKEG